jgi:hypothetical protein
MAPLQESLAASLYYRSGENILSFREIGVLFVGLYSAALFFLLASTYSRHLAIAVAILTALPGAALVCMRGFLPGYPVGMLASVLLVSALRFDFPRHHLLKGILAGFLHYLFPVLAPFLIVYIGVTCALAADEAGFFSAAWNPGPAFVMGFYSLFASPGVYFYLTRGRLPSDWRLASALLAAIGLCASILFLFVYRVPPSRRAALAVRIAILVVGFLSIWSAHNFLFDRVDAPIMSARHVNLNAASTYRLQPWPVWPRQASITVERILPLAALPVVPRSLLASYQQEIVPSAGYLFIGTLIVVGIVLGCIQMFQSVRSNWRTAMPRIIYPLGFVLSVLLLIPSWRLNSDYCVRYLMPALPGLWVLVLTPMESFIGKKGIVALALTCGGIACAGIALTDLESLLH